jgi:hypothetical protein
MKEDYVTITMEQGAKKTDPVEDARPREVGQPLTIELMAKDRRTAEKRMRR